MLCAYLFRNKTTPLDAAVLFHAPEDEGTLAQQGVQSRTKAAVPVDGGSGDAQPRLRPGMCSTKTVNNLDFIYIKAIVENQ